MQPGCRAWSSEQGRKLTGQVMKAMSEESGERAEVHRVAKTDAEIQALGAGKKTTGCLVEATYFKRKERITFMLGWVFRVYKQTDEGRSPATAESPKRSCLAAWQAGFEGIYWIEDLEKEGKAILLGGTVDLFRYTATAEYVIRRILDEPPEGRKAWTSGEFDDVLLEGWEVPGASIDRAAAEACCPDEWLLIEVGDMS